MQEHDNLWQTGSKVGLSMMQPFYSQKHLLQPAAAAARVPLGFSRLPVSSRPRHEEYADVKIALGNSHSDGNGTVAGQYLQQQQRPEPKPGGSAHPETAPNPAQGESQLQYAAYDQRPTRYSGTPVTDIMNAGSNPYAAPPPPPPQV